MNDEENFDLFAMLEELAAQKTDPEKAFFYRRRAQTISALLCAAWSRHARHMKSITTGELAYRLEISEEEVIASEMGKSPAPPTVEFMYQIAFVCQLDFHFEMKPREQKSGIKWTKKSGRTDWENSERQRGVLVNERESDCSLFTFYIPFFPNILTRSSQ